MRGAARFDYESLQRWGGMYMESLVQALLAGVDVAWAELGASRADARARWWLGPDAAELVPPLQEAGWAIEEVPTERRGFLGLTVIEGELRAASEARDLHELRHVLSAADWPEELIITLAASEPDEPQLVRFDLAAEANVLDLWVVDAHATLLDRIKHALKEAAEPAGLRLFERNERGPSWEWMDDQAG